MTTSTPSETEERTNRFRSLIKPLLAGGIATLLLLGFVSIRSEVLEDDTRAFDTSVLHSAQALRATHPWIAEVMRDLSGVGSTVALALFTTATVVYLVQCATLFCTYRVTAARAAFARVTLARMSEALAVQMKGLGWAL